MKTIKHLIGWIMTLCIVNSCGLDKLNNVVEYEFYIRNETGSDVVFTLKTYKQESSQLSTERVISINEDECVTLFGTLVVGEGFPYTDMDLFNHALIGDLREDTYAEAEMTEDGRKIRWSPHEINEESFYSPDSWIFEESEANGKSYKKWTFILGQAVFED